MQPTALGAVKADRQTRAMARAYAHTNIALVKYWGKRAGSTTGLNLPATGSLSLTLDAFGTDTEVVCHDGDTDVIMLDGAPLSHGEATRVSRFLDLVRDRAGRRDRCRVSSRNDVPTAAGLASSASGFAALALAASAAFDVHLDEVALSILARRGSGSAARSVFGGFVLLHRGTREDGDDCHAVPLHTSLDVRLVVVRTMAGKKEVSSTDGMDRTARTSPFFAAWVDTHAQDLEDAQAALAANDLEHLGIVTERSTWKMHATTLGADPPFWYFAPTTLSVLESVRAARRGGLPAWCTMDAGPHVKILTDAAHADAVVTVARAVPGVLDVDIAAPGPAARLLAP